MKWVGFSAFVLLFFAFSVGVSISALGDIVFSRKAGVSNETPSAVFPHWVHRVRFKCYVCHDAIFKMNKGANPITMEALMAGRYCAICHNGTISWPVAFETCQRCHVRP